MRKLCLAAALAALLPLATNAATIAVTAPLTVTISPMLGAPTFTPPAPSIACQLPAGSLVATASITGGDGQTVKWSLSGTSDFTIDSSGVISVGPSGVATADCGAPYTFPVTASQD